MALSPVFVELRAVTGEFQAKMGEARHEVSKLSTESSGHMKKFAAVGKAALTGIAAGAITLGGASIHMADTFELSHAKLQTAITDTGHAFNTFSKPVSVVDGQMEKLGFTNADTEGGLANLTTALGDPSKAMKDMGLAADLARAKNISLADASTAVARAQEGNLRALKSMGIDLPIAAKSAESLKVAQNSLKAATISYRAQLDTLHKKQTVTKADLETVRAAHVRLTFAQRQLSQAQNAGTLITDALNKKLGGEAANAADTFAGKEQTAKAMAEDFAAKIGMKLIPVLEKTITVVAGVVHWFEKHHGAALALAAVVGGVLVASIAAYAFEVGTTAVEGISTMLVSMGLMTGEAEASGTAMTAAFGPIGIAIGLLAVAGYELYKHWDTVWAGIKRIVGDAVGFVQRYASYIGVALIALGGPFGLLIGSALLLYKHWSTIWTGMKSVAGDLVGFVIQYVISPIVTAFLDFAGFMLNTAAHAFGWVPGIGGKLKGAANAFNSFSTGVKSTMAGLANSAYGWGEKTGENIASGVAAGMDAKSMVVYKKAQQLGGQSAKAVQFGAQVSSPSKITTYVGKMIALGLLTGFTGAAGKVFTTLSGAMQGALDSLHAVIDGAMTKMDARVTRAQTSLQNAIKARAQMAGQISSQLVSATDISGAVDQNTGKVGNISGFLGGQLAEMRKFARDIGLLRKQGLGGATLQSIVAAGPVQGVAMAESILSGSSGSVAQINREQKQIQHYAGQVGKTTADVVYAKAVARDHATLERQEALQKRMVELLHVIAGRAGHAGNPAAVRRDMRGLQRKLGKDYGIR